MDETASPNVHIRDIYLVLCVSLLMIGKNEGV